MLEEKKVIQNKNDFFEDTMEEKSTLQQIAEESGISEDEVLKALDIINTDLQKSESKEVAPVEEKKPEIDFKNITNIILDKINKIDEDQDTLHQHFFGEMVAGKDRSESSKVLVAEAHKTKAENVKSLVELVKAFTKLEQSKNNPKTGIVIVPKSSEEVGINFNNFATT